MKSFAFLLFFCLLASGHVLAEQSTLKIGYLTDLSEKGAFWGQQSILGAQIAAQELGIPKENLIIVDHRSSLSIAATEAQRLLTIESVDLILSDLTNTSAAIAPIVARYKVPMIHFSPSLEISRVNPSAFRLFLDYGMGCELLAKEFTKLNQQDLLIIKANSEFGELCAKGAKKVFSSAEEIAYDSGQDLNSELLRVINSQDFNIIQTGFETDFVSSFKRLKQMGRRPIIGMPFLLLTKPVEIAANDLKPKQLITFGYNSDGALEFQQKLKIKTSKIDINWQAAALSYLAIQQAVQMAEECPSKEISCRTKALSQATQSELLGFSGYVDRQASFKIQINTRTF